MKKRISQSHTTEEMSCIIALMSIERESITNRITDKYHDCLLVLEDRSELDFVAVDVKDIQIRYFCNGGIVG